jgi:hypothetical protein
MRIFPRISARIRMHQHHTSSVHSLRAASDAMDALHTCHQIHLSMPDSTHNSALLNWRYGNFAAKKTMLRRFWFDGGR